MSRWLAEDGLPSPRPPLPLPVSAVELARMYDEGKTAAEIAASIGVDSRRFVRELRAAGVTFDPSRRLRAVLPIDDVERLYVRDGNTAEAAGEVLEVGQPCGAANRSQSRPADQTGRSAVSRQTEPRIAARVWAALGDAQTVLNVGAGTGSYEPSDMTSPPWTGWHCTLKRTTITAHLPSSETQANRTPHLRITPVLEADPPERQAHADQYW